MTLGKRPHPDTENPSDSSTPMDTNQPQPPPTSTTPPSQNSNPPTSTTPPSQNSNPPTPDQPAKKKPKTSANQSTNQPPNKVEVTDSLSSTDDEDSGSADVNEKNSDDISLGSSDTDTSDMSDSDDSDLSDLINKDIENNDLSDDTSDEPFDPKTYNHDPTKNRRPIIIMDLINLMNKPPFNLPPPSFDLDDNNNFDPNPFQKQDPNKIDEKLGPILPNRLRNGRNPNEANGRKRRRGGPPPKPKPPIKRTKIDITNEIKTLDDLIDLPNKYEDKPELEYTFDMKKVKALQQPLKDLKNMVGLDKIKEQIVDQIMFLLSDLKDPDQNLHTVITGKPGCGKTSLSIILSQIYQALGFSNSKYRAVKRSDLVGMYLGHTANKTQRVIDSVQGGVLFIDEAYSLGNPEGRDSFSKEAIDTINQNLSEQKNNFICIIAGYKDALKKCFFAYNPGLTRRFPFRYDIAEYSIDQLREIFIRRLEASGWSSDEIPIDFFTKLKRFFVNQGGDMEILSQMSKIAYTRRIFGKHQDQKKHLILDDIIEGFNLFLKNGEVRSRMTDKSNPADGFYDRPTHRPSSNK